MLRGLVLLAAGLLLPQPAIPSPTQLSAALAQNEAPAEPAGSAGRGPSREGLARPVAKRPGRSGRVCGAEVQSETLPGFPSSLNLEWNAPAECPDGNAVRSDVIRLTGATTQGSRQLKARASIRPTAGTGWILSLATEVDGVTGERTLSGVSCESLADAAALMLALILNPDLVLPAPPPAVAQKAVPSSATIASTNDRRPRPLWRTGAHAGIQTGVLKDLSSSFALSLGFALGRFSLRLMPSLTPAQDVFADTQWKLGGRLWLATLAALGCGVAAIGRVALSPCLGFDVTWLHGHGLGVSLPREATVYWSSAELAVFAGLPLGHRVFLELGGIGLLPTSRPSVYLEGLGPVSRPAAFGFRALGGLAWVFE